MQVTTRGVCCGNHISEGADDVSTRGFEASLERTDPGHPSFGQQIHLQWLACPKHEPVHGVLDAATPAAPANTRDTYLVGFCNMLRCPTPGSQQNFG